MHHPLDHLQPEATSGDTSHEDMIKLGSHDLIVPFEHSLAQKIEIIPGNHTLVIIPVDAKKHDQNLETSHLLRFPQGLAATSPARRQGQRCPRPLGDRWLLSHRALSARTTRGDGNHPQMRHQTWQQTKARLVSCFARL